MKFDILLAGVGGQGVLSMAALIGEAAIGEGLHAKQSEVHGMAQRGGAVQAQLRLADHTIDSDLIPRGSVDLLLSLEPLEGLRYVDRLAPDGALVTSSAPVLNIDDYPALERVLEAVRALPHGVVVDAERLAEAAGDAQAVNTVMVGAASGMLPLAVGSLEGAVRRRFARKGPRTVEMNLAAFSAGRQALP